MLALLLGASSHGSQGASMFSAAPLTFLLLKTCRGCSFCAAV
jgi:hypothetical protein